MEIQIPYFRQHKKVVELLAKKYASLTAAALVSTDNISRQCKLDCACQPFHSVLQLHGI